MLPVDSDAVVQGFVERYGAMFCSLYAGQAKNAANPKMRTRDVARDIMHARLRVVLHEEISAGTGADSLRPESAQRVLYDTVYRTCQTTAARHALVDIICDRLSAMLLTTF